MNSLEGPGVAVAVRLEVFWSHWGCGLKHLHEHHVTHHPEQTCEDSTANMVKSFKGTGRCMLWMNNKITRAAPPRTVKTAAKALSSWPQRCVEGNQALIHNCTDSSVQLINSSPMYMSSNESDSHIIAAQAGEAHRPTEGLAEGRARRDTGGLEEHTHLSQRPESACKSRDTSPLQIRR